MRYYSWKIGLFNIARNIMIETTIILIIAVVILIALFKP